MVDTKKKEKTVKISAGLLLIVWLFIVFILSPLGTVIGLLNGDLDLETLEPRAYEYKPIVGRCYEDK